MSNLTAAPSSDVKVLSGTGSLFDRQALRFGRLGKWAVGHDALVALDVKGARDLALADLAQGAAAPAGI